MTTMKYGGVPSDEAEVTIRLDKQDRIAHVCSTWAEWSRKFERRHGAPPKYQERDGVVIVARWTLPLAAISIRRPRKPGSQVPQKSILPSVAPRKVPFPGKRIAKAIQGEGAGR